MGETTPIGAMLTNIRDFLDASITTQQKRKYTVEQYMKALRLLVIKSASTIIVTEAQQRIFEHNSKVMKEDEDEWDIDSSIDDFDFDDEHMNKRVMYDSIAVSREVESLIK